MAAWITGGGAGVDREQRCLDGKAEQVVAFLKGAGADTHRHAGGRSLLDHLVGTYEIVRRWNQPEWLQLAALIHSVYGTDVHRQQLLHLSRRGEVSDLVGQRAERIAFLFGASPRGPLFAGTYRWATGAAAPRLPDADASAPRPASRGELDAVLLLHMANLAEQACAEDGSPGQWLFKLRQLAEPLVDSEAVTLPAFVAGLVVLTPSDEQMARRAYRGAVSGGQGSERVEAGLALANAGCPVVAEPCIWLAYFAHRRGDSASAREWARCARRRLVAAGVVWDKRLDFSSWLELARALEGLSESGLDRELGAATDPLELFQQVIGAEVDRAAVPALTVSADAPDAAAGRARFQRYVDLLAESDSTALKGVYPDLRSQPWYDPQSFSISRYLEGHAEEIRRELLGLAPEQFHREAERIPRDGNWDVLFFYERGRRHAEVCDACPITTRGIESAGAMRSAAGLIYVSRMRPRTHIRAHRGPTNLRLRCHLAIQVPEGDCAIRVGEQTRNWTEGECLVFSDYHDHEAWNHTDDDRLVLIVDLWHPGLSRAEIELLSGLHRYAFEYGRRLTRYWAANAAAAGGAPS